MVNPGMTGLETQFQALGFQAEGEEKPHSVPNGESDTAEDNDGTTETEDAAETEAVEITAIEEETKIADSTGM